MYNLSNINHTFDGHWEIKIRGNKFFLAKRFAVNQKLLIFALLLSQARRDG